MDVGYYCREFAGIHSAIQMSGGRLTAHGVSISEFFSTVAHHPRKNTGIDIANLDRAILERITVESMKGFVNRYDDADRDDDDTVCGFRSRNYRRRLLLPDDTGRCWCVNR
ncbi:MAG: hypothetical protein R2851_08785 [Caldilineaceae bacterium]